MATVKFTTPKGTARYPWLTKADFEFKETGEFKTQLRVPVDVAQPLIQIIEKQVLALATEIAAESEKKGKKLDPKKIAPKLKRPYAECEEDDGFIIFKLSQNAVVQGKNVTINFFDASGKRIAPEDTPAVFGGSIIRVSGGARTYAAGANKGVKLDIYAVQIIELAKSTKASSSADDYGFGEEEGFTHETDAAAAGFDDDAMDSMDDGEEDIDF